MNCRGINAKGEPCAIDERLVQENGYCRSHDPEKGSRYMSEIGRRGQEAIREQAKAAGVSAEELGELEDLADAKRWLKILGAATAEGRLSDRKAQAAIRAVSEWVKAHENATSAEMYQEVRAGLDQLKEEVATRGRQLKAVR